MQNHLQLTEQFAESQAASWLPQEAIWRGLLEVILQLVIGFIEASQNKQAQGETDSWKESESKIRCRTPFFWLSL